MDEIAGMKNNIEKDFVSIDLANVTFSNEQAIAHAFASGSKNSISNRRGIARESADQADRCSL